MIPERGEKGARERERRREERDKGENVIIAKVSFEL